MSKRRKSTIDIAFGTSRGRKKGSTMADAFATKKARGKRKSAFDLLSMPTKRSNRTSRGLASWFSRSDRRTEFVDIATGADGLDLRRSPAEILRDRMLGLDEVDAAVARLADRQQGRSVAAWTGSQFAGNDGLDPDEPTPTERRNTILDAFKNIFRR